MNLSLAAGLAFMYVGSGLCLFAACARGLPRAVAAAPATWLALGLATGPAVLSRFVLWLLTAFPARTPMFYFVAASVPFVLMAGIGGVRAWHPLTALLHAWRARRPTWRLAVYAAAAGGIASAWSLADPAPAAALEAFHAKIMLAWQPAESWWAGGMTRLGPPILGTLAALACVPVLRGPVLPARVRAGLVGLFGVLLLVLMAGLLVLVLGRPVYENDALQYFKIAALMAEHRSLAFYPLLEAFPGDGMLASSAHPLGYFGTLVWSSWLSSPATPGVAKLVAPFHLLMVAVLVARLARGRGLATGLGASLLLVTTPALYIQTLGLGIDAMRLCLLTATVVVLREALRAGDLRTWGVAGLVAGLSMNSHSINGLLTPLIVLGIVLSDRRLAWSAAIPRLALLGLCALLVGGDRYALNLVALGSPFYDRHALWDLVPSLDYLAWRARGLAAQDAWHRLLAGPGLGFTSWYEWGFSHWLALGGVLTAGRAIWREDGLRDALVASGIVLGFLVLYFGFVPASGAYVFNYRYLMTALPFVCVLGGSWLEVVRTARADTPGLIGTIAVSALLLFQAAMIAGRLLAPQLPDADTSRAFARTRAEDLALRPQPEPGPYMQELDVIAEIRARTPRDAFFLVFSQNAFAFYAERRFIRDVDLRLVPFYRATSDGEALKVLRALGIEYVYLPPWMDWPTISRSRIMAVVGNPGAAHLVFEHRGFRLYRMRQSP